MPDIDLDSPLILINDAKVGRFMNKWNIMKNNADKSRFYCVPQVMARNMAALVKMQALQIVLMSEWLGNTDQSMMCMYHDRLTSYCTHNAKRNHGKKKPPDGSRSTYTHNPHLLYNTRTGKGELGESQVHLLCLLV